MTSSEVSATLEEVRQLLSRAMQLLDQAEASMAAQELEPPSPPPAQEFDPSATVAERVRQELNRHGFKLKHLAERIGVSEGQASRLMKGKARFKHEHIKSIGSWLGASSRRLRGVAAPDDGVLLTVSECAEIAKRHPETIRKAIRAGDLNSVQQVAKGKHLIMAGDLYDWIPGKR